MVALFVRSSTNHFVVRRRYATRTIVGRMLGAPSAAEMQQNLAALSDTILGAFWDELKRVC
jgi:hypothetical protein